jgi:hypothetical protein
MKKRKSIIREALRQKTVPIIRKEQVQQRMKASSMTVAEFFSEEIPYLNVGGNYKLLLDDYIIDSPMNAKGTYRVNTQLMTIEETDSEGIQDYDITDFLNEMALIDKEIQIGTEKIPTFHALCYTFTSLLNKTWIDENEKLSTNTRNKLSELFNVHGDPPLSTRPNFIHMFVFLNKMPLLMKCMTKNNKAEIKQVLQTEGLMTDEVMASINEVRDLALKTHASNIYNSFIKDIFDVNKSELLSAFVPMICPGGDEIYCSDYTPKIEILVNKIDDLRKVVSEMNKLQKNTGYVFLLNYWMYRVIKMSQINGRFPVNLKQQMQTLKTMLTTDAADSETLKNLKKIIELQQKTKNDIPLIETMGKYKVNGVTYQYQNCVEKSIFKMIQVMMYKGGQYDTDMWTSIDPKLKEYMQSLDHKYKDRDDWNDIVCNRKEYQYNSSDGYNIKSNLENVLRLLNTLSGGTQYKSLEEWVMKVYKGNNVRVEEGNRIILMERYIVQILDGHTRFIIKYTNEKDADKDMEEDNEGVIILKTLRIGLNTIPILYMFKLDEPVFDSFYFDIQGDLDFGSVLSKETRNRVVNSDDILIDYRKSSLSSWIVLERQKLSSLSDQQVQNLIIRLNILSLKHLLEGITEMEYEYRRSPEPGLLPSSLTSLKMTWLNQPLETGVLPTSLKTLVMDHFDQPLEPGVFPSSLEVLEMETFDQPLKPGVLPSSLKTLVMDFFNQPLEPGVLPSSLEVLKMESFDQPLAPGVFPSSLEILEMESFDRPLKPGVLPPSLTKLVMNRYDRPLQPGILPSSLNRLKMRNFSQPLKPGVLPPSLRSLITSRIRKTFQETT